MAPAKRHILIAEDNRALAQVFRFNLERAGFNVHVTHDGAAAARELAVRGFDLIITDLQMPGVNGAALCRMVREELDHKTVPIAVCTAKGLEIDQEQMAASWGVTKVFHKPVSPQEMVRFAVELLQTESVVATA